MVKEVRRNSLADGEPAFGGFERKDPVEMIR
jgi:hypothetical protein